MKLFYTNSNVCDLSGKKATAGKQMLIVSCKFALECRCNFVNLHNTCKSFKGAYDIM